MRTNVVLDDELVEEAFQLSGARTKRQLLREALIELVRARRRRPLIELAGRIQFVEDFDPKEVWSVSRVDD